MKSYANASVWVPVCSEYIKLFESAKPASRVRFRSGMTVNGRSINYWIISRLWALYVQCRCCGVSCKQSFECRNLICEVTSSTQSLSNYRSTVVSPLSRSGVLAQTAQYHLSLSQTLQVDWRGHHCFIFLIDQQPRGKANTKTVSYMELSPFWPVSVKKRNMIRYQVFEILLPSWCNNKQNSPWCFAQMSIIIQRCIFFSTWKFSAAPIPIFRMPKNTEIPVIF